MPNNIGLDSPLKYGQSVDPTELNRVPVTLVFNRLNGSFITATSLPYSFCDIGDPLCIYLTDEMDLHMERIEGGLDIIDDDNFTPAYKVVPILNGIVEMTEMELNNHVATKITKRYKVVDQINIMARAIMKLSTAAGIDQDELEEYMDYVETVKATNRLQREFYSKQEGYSYVSIKDHEAATAKTFEGGLHERLGPRTLSGGTVF